MYMWEQAVVNSCSLLSLNPFSHRAFPRLRWYVGSQVNQSANIIHFSHKSKFLFQTKWFRSKTDVSLKVECININLFSSEGGMIVKMGLFKIVPAIMAKLKFLTAKEI